jgi:pyruvate dehydrogenase E2 component (dihydrolipoamide acetyltransferase)
MTTIDVKVPDIGDFKDVPVIEVLVKAGDAVGVDASLVTLESDKATMDVPSPAAGTVKSVGVKVGDKVSEGSLVLTLETEAGARPSPAPAAGAKGNGAKGSSAAPGEGASATPPAGPTTEVRVPDIGDFKDVPVIEVFVKPGDVVKPDDPVVTLESDKATMDVPAPIGGVVEAVRVSVGAKVSEGTLLLTLRGAAATPQPASRVSAPAPTAEPNRGAKPAQVATSGAAATAAQREAPPKTEAPAAGGAIDAAAMRAAHASPSVRKFARELGVDLGKVTGSGPKGRILQEDVQQFVKRALAAPAAAGGGVTGGGALNLLPWPSVDFAKFGPVEAKPLSRIRKISGANLARNWVMIPHVTQFDDADITDLEALRLALNKENEKAGIKVTMLAFLIKASVAALQRFPDFNASLDPGGESLVYKRYFNIGFAADTPNGLVVPVLKGADQKGILQIAKEMAELSAKARDGKLGPSDMQGGCFSISSLGGIGGTAFTPIVNAPEVAILGVSRSALKPVWDGKQFAPRLMLPLSLSYDHRVVDGAQAARFITYFAGVLADFRRVVL